MWSADPVPRWTHYGRWDADGLTVRHCPDCRNGCDFVIFRLPVPEIVQCTTENSHEPA